ncbi:hypothetical protein MYBA111488_24475 [Mycobacterium basiliense]
MQVPSGIRFGPKYGIDPFRRQRRNHRVVKHAGGVNHGGQRLLRPNLSKHLGQHRTIRRVTRHHPHARTGATEFGDQSRRPWRLGATPTHQHQMAHAVASHHMARQRRTRHAGTAGDQHRARRPGVRHRHDDLADMACLTQVPQRRRGPSYIKRVDRQRPQHTRLEQCSQIEHVLVHARTAGFEEVEGAVAHTRVFLGDDPRVPNVGLAHLQKHSAGAQQSQ